MSLMPPSPFLQVLVSDGSLSPGVASPDTEIEPTSAYAPGADILGFLPASVMASDSREIPTHVFDGLCAALDIHPRDLDQPLFNDFMPLLRRLAGEA